MKCFLTTRKLPFYSASTSMWFFLTLDCGQFPKGSKKTTRTIERRDAAYPIKWNCVAPIMFREWVVSNALKMLMLAGC